MKTEFWERDDDPTEVYAVRLSGGQVMEARQIMRDDIPYMSWGWEGKPGIAAWLERHRGQFKQIETEDV